MSHKLTACHSDFDLYLTFLLLTAIWLPHGQLNEMAMSPKEHKPDKSESNNSLELNFTNVQGQGLCLNLSLNQTLLAFLLYVRQT